MPPVSTPPPSPQPSVQTNFTTPPPPPINTPIPPPITPPQSHGLLITLIIVLVLLIAGVWLWQTQSADEATPEPAPIDNLVEPVVGTDPTATWQTYYNGQHGFEFKYPEKDIAIFSPLIVSTGGRIGLPANAPAGLRETIPNIDDVAGAHAFPSKVATSITSAKTSDNHDARIVYYYPSLSENENPIGTTIVIESPRPLVMGDGSWAYLVLGNSDIPPDIVDQILSTFKFTTSPSSTGAQTATYDIFKSQVMNISKLPTMANGFRIQYPAAWQTIKVYRYEEPTATHPLPTGLTLKPYWISDQYSADTIYIGTPGPSMDYECAADYRTKGISKCVDDKLYMLTRSQDQRILSAFDQIAAAIIQI